MKIEWVRTEKPGACVISALAMVTGKPFNEIFSHFKILWNLRGRIEGIDFADAYQYLAHHGFAVQVVEHEYRPHDRLLQTWPCRPFAPVHICRVNAGDYHAVVMLKDGTVYDPDDRRCIRRELAGYHRVHSVAGVWPVKSGIIAL